MFVGYARADAHHLDTFRMYTADLERNGVRFADDRAVPPGADWEPTLLGWLDAADIVVLLITPAFVASRYCVDVEFARARGRRPGVLFPVHVAPFDVGGHAPLRDLQWIPSGQSIVERRDDGQAWVEVARALRRRVDHLRTGTPPPTRPDRPYSRTR